MAKRNMCAAAFRDRYRQSTLLLKKNLILMVRNKKATIVQLLVPIGFIAVLFLLQFANQENDRRSVDRRFTRNSSDTLIAPIPRCAKFPDKDRCYTMAYTNSRDKNVQLIMQQIQLDNGIPDEEVISFVSESQSNLFLLNNPNMTTAVYQISLDYGCDSISSAYAREVCFGEEHDLDEIRGMRYVVQYNNTFVGYRGAIVDPFPVVALPFLRALDRAVFWLFGRVEYEVVLLPFPHPTLATTDVIGTVGPYFFFGALMFNFVIQIGQIVTENQFKLRESMKVMGLRDFSFWFTWLITNIIMNTISVLVLICAGLLFQFPFFLKNDFPLYFIHLFLFGLSMVPAALFVATLIRTASTATSLGFIIFLVGSIIQVAAGQIYREEVNLAWRVVFSFFPFAVFTKGLSDLGRYARDDKNGLRWEDRDDYGFFPLSEQWNWYGIDIGIYIVLTWFFDAVLYLKLKPWFMFTRSYWVGAKKKSVQKTNADDDAAIELLENMKDADVREEEELIKAGKISDNTAVVLNKLVKTYQKKNCGCCPTEGGVFRAVKGTYLTIDEGNLLVLLGHNGAGKTTTIGMLTGLLTPTSGDALIFGNSIISGMDEIRQVMGVCPQYDILWSQLTGREHLELFAALKEVGSGRIQSEVIERLTDVDLLKAQNIPSGSYSGGMKRRLSVAIALIGNPKIVFLDEPTTGMDPVSRRKVWNLIEKVKRGRVTLLTTHSMEEADILGDKIAIMKDGYLAAVGTNLRLKNKFGTGYSVTVLCDAEKTQAVRQFVESEFAERIAQDSSDKRKKSIVDVEEEQFSLMSEMPGVLEYKVPSRYADTMSDFFEHVEARRKEFSIHDVQLSLTTLEDVFLRVAHQEEYKEKTIRKYKSDFKTPFGLLGAAVALLLVAAIILAGVLLPLPIPIPQDSAPARATEPRMFVPAGDWSASFYPSGLLVGDAYHDSAVISIQTAITSNIVVLEGDGESDAWTVVQVLNDTVPTPFFNVIQLTLANLTEDTPYAVVAFASNDTSLHTGATRFRTALDPSRGVENNPRKITFGATCCLGRANAPFGSLSYAADEDFDFFLLLGNSAYCDGAQSPQQFQARWNTTMTTQGFLDLARSTSFIATWDDQELFEQWNYVIYDPVISASLPPILLANMPGLIELAKLSYRNALPQRMGPNNEIYRSVQWGEVIEVFVLDVRTNRTNVTMITQDQMEWLKGGLSNSTAVFKIIMTANAFTRLNGVLGSFTAPFRWDGYESQQNEVLDHVYNSNITGVLWVAGGLNFGMFSHLDKNNTIGWDYYEVGVGPSGSQINTYLRLNPFVSIDSDQFEFVFDTWTYTKFEADPISRNMTISFVDDSGIVIDTKVLTL